MLLFCSGPGSGEAKRGPGRPPVRLTPQPSLTGRTSKRKSAAPVSAAGITGATAYGTNELVGRKIWCALSIGRGMSFTHMSFTRWRGIADHAFHRGGWVLLGPAYCQVDSVNSRWTECCFDVCGVLCCALHTSSQVNGMLALKCCIRQKSIPARSLWE